METILRLAIQKSGRLSEKTLELLKNCSLDFNTGTSQLKSRASNFPIEILYLRDDDIPGYVFDSVADIGIVGMNVVDEKEFKVKVIESLGFSKCRLSVAVPVTKTYQGIHDLEGKIIATSYPNIVSKFLKEQGVNADIHEISGSVEIAPAIGLTDAICDIVSTGGTLMSNGLRETEVIYRSEAVLIGAPNLSLEKKQLLDKLMLRIKAVQRAKMNKYIILNTPNAAIDKIISILPGMKSPTVTPLAIQGWSSMHSVVNENDFWEIIEKLKEAGAEGILVVPIEKMIY
jgi:ATP phosphoribosyltransferase